MGEADLPGGPGGLDSPAGDFTGTFRCTPTGAGPTTLRHTETFRFHPAPMERLAGRVLGRWLQREVETEVHRLKELIES